MSHKIFNRTVLILFACSVIITHSAYTQSGFECGDQVTYEGQTYNTVQIGNQCWLKENLNVGTRINGTSSQANNGIIEKYCYDDNENNCDTYGGLYQWDEMMQYTRTEGSQGICPGNWHIPTDEEWKILEGTVDSQYGVGNSEWDGTEWRGYDAGKRLKSTSDWYSNGNGTDAFGFSALPGGRRNSDGNSFLHLGQYSLLWSSTEQSSLTALRRFIYYSNLDVNRIDRNKTAGYSVRCLHDNTNWPNTAGNLKGYYPFNGNADDESGNGYHGTVNGAELTNDRFGNNNTAYEFELYTDNINTGIDLSNDENFTINTWVYLENNSTILNHNNIWTTEESNSGCDSDLFCDITKSNDIWKVRFQAYRGGGYHYGITVDSTGNIVTIGQWNMITCIKQGNILELYINGEFKENSEVDLSGKIGSDLWIGHHYNACGWHTLEGGCDDIRVYYKALIESEILELYNEGQTASDCGGAITDTRDGQTYNTVQIGNQCWMAEDLNYESGNSWCYDNDPLNCNIYGRLYDWQTALDICPASWHLPSDDEWKILEGTVDTQYDVYDPEWNGTEYRGYDAGKRLKSTSGWNSNGNGTDTFGFTALPSGIHHANGSFSYIGNHVPWWSSTEGGTTSAWHRYLNYDSDEVHRDLSNKEHGFSVRCILSLSSGTIVGQVSNTETGTPIEGAIITATGNLQSTYTTNSIGEYTINNVPFGYGYEVTATKEGCETTTVSNINVTSSNSNVTVDIEMTPVDIDYQISNLSPNPNPATSQVRHGGTLHRYYYVTNSNTGLPVSQAQVKVEDESGTVFTYYSNEDGIVDISIASNLINNGDIGDTYDFSIIQVGDEVLASTIDFTCEIIDKEYYKYWENNEFGKLGISFLSVEFERGSSVMLTENDQSTSGAELINVTRQGRAGAGVDFSVGASAGVSCGSISAGAGASAGVGGSISGVTEDYYQFPHQNYTSNQALIQYLLFADGNFSSLDNTLIRLLSKIEEIFSQQSTIDAAYLGDKKGIELEAHASAGANIGVGVGDNLGIGADANIGVGGKAALNFLFHDQEGLKETNFSLSGSVSASASAGINLEIPLYEDSDDNGNIEEWSTELGSTISIFDYSGTRGLEFSIFRDNTTNDLEKIQLKFVHRVDSEGWEEVLTYEIGGNDVESALQTLENQFGQVSLISNPASGSDMQISNGLFSQLTFALFAALYDLQVNEQGDATVTYRKDRKEITECESFEINIKGKLGISLLQAEVGGGTGFEEGIMMMKEKGKWVWGNHLVTEYYDENIPEIDEEYAEVVQEIVNEIPQWIRISLGVLNVITFWTRDENMFYITDSTNTDTTAWINFPAGSVPATLDSIYCVSWGWYGNSTRTLLSDIQSPKVKRVYKLNRERSESSFGMEYGVGGFFQVEPIDTLLLDTAQMTITYMDSSVVNIDELTLGMYIEDKPNHTWIYVGGDVDTANNQVTAPITKLGLYTLAPEMPMGSFTLTPVNDSIYADSITTTAVNSGYIFCNNADTVENGELFTINTDAGKITTSDADTSIAGIQVSASGGQISFNVKSSHVASTATVSATSVNGSATADTLIVFYDTIPPDTPAGLTASSQGNRIKLSWNQNDEEDLSGYVVYFDTDSLGAPYDGLATVYGTSSPIVLGKDTSYNINGLFSDSTYYVTITAYDVSGNESDYATEVVKDLTLPDNLYIGETEITSDDTLCYDALSYIELPTASNTFEIDSGGSVTVISGNKIAIKPGFKANSGSYFHASITTTGSYCSAVPVPQMPETIINEHPETDIIIISNEPEAEEPYKVYPNPTHDIITIEFNQQCKAERCYYEIYDYMGKMTDRIVITSRKQKIDLSGKQDGVYFILIRNGDSVYRIKVVKV